MSEKNLNLALAEVEKRFGKGTLVALNSIRTEAFPVISTGNKVIDELTGIGGFPRGRITEVYGPECLSESTFIQYEIQSPDGTRSNHKGGTIARLYERFHNLKSSGDGRGKNRPVPEGTIFTAPSVNEQNRIVQNRILNVVDAGTKECFAVTTESGHRIEAAADHQFLTECGYLPLAGLCPGTDVFIHNNTPFKVAKQKDSNKKRHFVYVQHHPIAGVKNCGGYLYHRLRRARAVMEAQLNGLDFDAYVARLNAGQTDGLKFLSREINVHHKDENEENDLLENLETVHSIPHGVLHATQRHNNLRFVAVLDRIESIKSVGFKRVYDISMDVPYNNYVADGFIVHNSGGKTTLCLHVIAEAQKAGGLCVYVDAEHALDPEYAAKLGVNTDKLLLSQPDCGEDALEIVLCMVRSGAVAVIVVDSVSALVPRKELEGDIGDAQMGLQARMMSQAMRMLTKAVADTGTVLVFINQVRDKIGVMFGNPETTSGGRALKFAASLRLDVRRIGQKKKGDEVIGAMTIVKSVKNKLAAPYKKFEILLTYGKGFANPE